MATTAAFTFSLSLLTWNTYFAPHRWADRMAGILQTCAAIQPHSPHVIYLQEVLPQFLLLPGWDAWLDRHGYVSSATDPADLAPYGVMTLAKRHLSSHFEEVPLPSRMGRRLLIAHLRDAASGRQWRVGNVHLESMDSAPSRREQLAVAGRVMGGGRGDESSIIGGDFNFDADRNYDVRPGVPLENDALASTLHGWADVWPLLHGGDSGEKGYTFDATVNSLLERPRPDERMRYDRVMARMAEAGGSRPVPVGIELVGTRPTEDGLFLSDHFGLLAIFGAQDDRKWCI